MCILTVRVRVCASEWECVYLRAYMRVSDRRGCDEIDVGAVVSDTMHYCQAWLKLNSMGWQNHPFLQCRVKNMHKHTLHHHCSSHNIYTYFFKHIHTHARKNTHTVVRTEWYTDMNACNVRHYYWVVLGVLVVLVLCGQPVASISKGSKSDSVWTHQDHKGGHDPRMLKTSVCVDISVTGVIPVLLWKWKSSTPTNWWKPKQR